MKGLVKYARGEGNIEIRDFPEPTVGKKQVKIEVKATGICGSDLHIYHDDIAIKLNPPVIIGHEFSGFISEVGEETAEWKVGDRVTSELGFEVCGSCDPCRCGFPNLCDNRRSVGYWYNGAFTKYVVVPACGVHRLPSNLTFREGALIEPLACVVHAVLELTHITAGDVVLITGPGAIGLSAMQVAKAHGAAVVVAGTESDATRLDLAKKLGADLCVNSGEDDLLKAIYGLTDNRGADIVLECSGNERAINTALLAIKKMGQYTQIGLFGKPVTVDIEQVCYKEIKLTGSLGQRWSSWEKAIQLVSQAKVKLNPLISHVLSITEWKKAFQMFEEQKAIKIILIPEK